LKLFLGSIHRNKKLANIEFASQNCQSLNIATKNKKTSLKINAILKKKCDVVFLSDVRLNSNIQKHAVFDIEKRFSMAGYDFYHNSTFSSRGVGILI
jgi:hypothetical protein